MSRSKNLFFLAFLWADVSEGFLAHSRPDQALNVAVQGDYYNPYVQSLVAEHEAETTRKPETEKQDAVAEGKNQNGTTTLKPKYAKQLRRRPDTKRPKYPVITKWHKRLEMVFGKIADVWWMDWKLWIGFVLWVVMTTKWIVQHQDQETYIERGLHSFGVNVMILHVLQYSSTIKTGMLGVNAMLAVQTLCHTAIWYTPAKGEEFEADTLYLDMLLPVEQIVVLFIAQFCVWWFYMTSILNNFELAHANYAFWLVAFLSMQMTMIFSRGGDSVLGNPFPVPDVCRMVKDAGTLTFVLKDDDQAAPFTLSRANLLMRGLTGFCCNSILRDIMSYTIPLMLMGFSEPMDFVVYCVGVNFICTLDDMTSRTYCLKDSTVDDELEAPAIKVSKPDEF